MESDIQYYARRAAEEQRAAERAASSEAERSHRTLAALHNSFVERRKSAFADDEVAQAD